MTDSHMQEYDDSLMAVLEAIWGEGFMSPGGGDEVDRYLDGIDLQDKLVLDIGCGLGGVDIHLLRQHGASQIIGVDIDPALIDRCQQLAQNCGVQAQAQFICIEPGALPFADASFDIVTSKDSIIHIADKHALAADVYRTLRPGGWFAASDWLAGYEDQPSPEMDAYIKAEGLDFNLASAASYADALQAAGFVDIGIVDRNEWYREVARVERKELGEFKLDELASSVETGFLQQQIDVWDKMIVALDQGQLRPTHLRGRKPDPER